jgi:integrase
VLAATGLRESELLGLRWTDFDADAGTVTVTGKLVRATGYGLTRIDDTKSAAGKRTLPLPRFAADALTARRRLPFLGEQAMIFPSSAGTWRDPNNFNKQWRQVRDQVGADGVTTPQFSQNGRHSH